VGWIVGREGYRPDHKKIASVVNFELGKYSPIKKVRSFLGITNYVRKFIKDYAETAAPLRKLTTKNPGGNDPEDDNEDIEDDPYAREHE